MEFNEENITTIGTPITQIIEEEKRKHTQSKARKRTNVFNNSKTDYISMFVNGACSAVAFLLVTNETIESLYGNYITDFYNNGKVTLKGKLIQALLIIILFIVIKIWVLDQKS